MTSRVWTDLVGVTSRYLIPFCLPAPAASVAHLETEVPAGATGEIRRVLAAPNYYEVLQVHLNPTSALLEPYILMSGFI